MQVQTYVKKADAKFETDFDKLPQAAREYIISYGWRQAIADAAASAKDEGEAKGLCQKRFDNLLKGIVRAERESDPVAQEAKKLAVALANKWAKKEGIVLVAKDGASDEVKAQVAKNMEIFAERVAAYKVREDVVALAEKNVAALAELADVEL